MYCINAAKHVIENLSLSSSHYPELISKIPMWLPLREALNALQCQPHHT